ncbi:hypothetical protein ACN38_g11823 [Penicillium nordicum]|uniref:Uncharacterized protein n=1 Tax=Penicillium nordicum TaxID=229535 RepID=A0A0M8NQL4_9EURO|nr:hypothetical protein ACN38_g11823 [Penicillium nordicum]
MPPTLPPMGVVSHYGPGPVNPFAAAAAPVAPMAQLGQPMPPQYAPFPYCLHVHFTFHLQVRERGLGIASTPTDHCIPGPPQGLEWDHNPLTPVYLDRLVLGRLRDWAEPAVDKSGWGWLPVVSDLPGVWAGNAMIRYITKIPVPWQCRHCQGTNTCTLKAQIHVAKSKFPLLYT